MKQFLKIALAAAAFSVSSAAGACPNVIPPARAFDLVVDGSAQFVGRNRIRIDVKRTVRGPPIKHLTVANAQESGDEIRCGPAYPWMLFGTDLYPRDRTYKGRFYLIRYQNGRYLIHWFVQRGKA